MGLQNETRLLIVRITPGTYSARDSWPYFPGRLEEVCTLNKRLDGTSLLIVGITPGTYSTIDSWPNFLVGLSRCVRYTSDWMGLQNGTIDF